MLAVLLSASGCGLGRDAGKAVDLSPAGGGVLAGVRSGLFVRQLRVPDEPQAIADALRRHAEDGGLEETARATLERNGMRLLRLPIDRMKDLRRDLGDASLDVEGWHGQALGWREIAARSIGGGSSQAVAVDGRMRVLSGGRLSMMMRGWTMQMEDGPTIYVELRPVHDRSQLNRIERMLGRKRFSGEHFDALRLDLQMDEGFAYVLLAGMPDVDWTAPDEREPPDEPPAARRAGFGPDAPVPPTMGELLLIPGTDPPQRDLLVFVPEIPAGLFPPAHDALAGQGDSRD